MKATFDSHDVLLALDFTDQAPSDALPGPFSRLQSQLNAYAARERLVFDMPFRLQGTPFQQRVWQALLELPFGVTTTYGAMARSLNTASQAVGQALSRNPIAIIVPCHRVIGARGHLTGYAGGVQRKLDLLVIEQVLS